MSKNKIDTIFIGTPDFGIPSLKSLIDSDLFNVVAVITQPDRKSGRKQILTPPPIKRFAIENNIQVFQPEKIKDFVTGIKELSPEMIVVIAYAQIIPEEILNIPKFGCINVHGSLLPKYRGASCIQAALINNDKKTGVTIMKMDKGLDTGDIIDQVDLEIETSDNAGTLFEKLSSLSGEKLVSVLGKYISGDQKVEKQDGSTASYVGLLKKSDGEIDWRLDAENIINHVRAMTPWPGAFTHVQIGDNTKILKILETGPITNLNTYKVGEIFEQDGYIAIQCGNNSIIIKTLQLEGKKAVSSKDFLKGHRNFIKKELK